MNICQAVCFGEDTDETSNGQREKGLPELRRHDTSVTMNRETRHLGGELARKIVRGMEDLHLTAVGL